LNKNFIVRKVQRRICKIPGILFLFFLVQRTITLVAICITPIPIRCSAPQHKIFRCAALNGKPNHFLLPIFRGAAALTSLARVDNAAATRLAEGGVHSFFYHNVTAMRLFYKLPTSDFRLRTSCKISCPELAERFTFHFSLCINFNTLPYFL
jgi:hypothetical protein